MGDGGYKEDFIDESRDLLKHIQHFILMLTTGTHLLQGSVWSLKGMCKQSNHDYFVEFLRQTFRMRQIAFKMRGYEIDQREINMMNYQIQEIRNRFEEKCYDTWCQTIEGRHVDCNWPIVMCPNGCENQHLRMKCKVDGDRGYVLEAGKDGTVPFMTHVTTNGCNTCCMNVGCSDYMYSPRTISQSSLDTKIRPTIQLTKELINLNPFENLLYNGHTTNNQRATFEPCWYQTRRQN